MLPVFSSRLFLSPGEDRGSYCISDSHDSPDPTGLSPGFLNISHREEAHIGSTLLFAYRFSRVDSANSTSGPLRMCYATIVQRSVVTIKRTIGTDGSCLLTIIQDPARKLDLFIKDGITKWC